MSKQYILMNRTDKAAALMLNTASEEHIIDNLQVINSDKLPFPARYSKGPERITALEEWIFHRLLSRHRYGLKKILSLTQLNRLESSLQSYGLTLTDGFWFKPEYDQSLSWEQINFFENSFSNDIGNLAFGIQNNEPDYITPDLTTNGRMEKTWRRRNDTTWLLKKGSPPYFEEPFNEKAISQILRKISKVPFVDYDITFVQNYAVSICRNFTQQGVEFVSAADIAKTEQKPSYLDMEMHLMERCKFFQIPGYKDFLNQLKIIDYITGNMDRHMGNYGFLYNSENDKFLGPAPIYDNGSALWCDVRTEELQEPINVSRQAAKQLVHTLKHPETWMLPVDLKHQLNELISNIYAEAGLYSDRAVYIEHMLTQRYQCLTEAIEHEVEKRMNRDDVLLAYAKKQREKQQKEKEVNTRG